MAICLTTMLLVIISTVGNGVIHLQKSQAAGSYGKMCIRDRYTGDHFEALAEVRNRFPEKELIFTEGCVEYSLSLIHIY